jgi:hypothetical protein
MRRRRWVAGVAGLLMASIPLAGQDVPGRLLISVRAGVDDAEAAQTLKRMGRWCGGTDGLQLRSRQARR